MCLTLPARIVALEPGVAVVEIDGLRRRASTILGPRLRTGDWVLVAAGTVVDRLSAREAEQLRIDLHAVTAAALPGRTPGEGGTLDDPRP